ncbi:MAG: M28 family peptidase [Ignavibacteriales bacterium]|nr:M28 family peptidase [Ignavibacteriales bacterium]
MCEKKFAAFLLLCFVACDQRQQQPVPQQQMKSIDPLVSVPVFDGQEAYRFLTAQTDFGPRNPGSEGYRRCLRFLQDEMGKYAERVFLQEFSHTNFKGERHNYANIISQFNRNAVVRVMLSAHWDTRPWADNDEDSENHDKPILGANDGASGVAVLLELTRQFKKNLPPVGVDIVLFDAEDIGRHGDQRSYAVGSQHFAKNLPAGLNPRFAVNLDMVGDKILTIPREQNSDKYAPAIMNLIYSSAQELGIPEFVNGVGEEIFDDHIPLNEAGIPSVDLIDFNYPDNSNRYWHSLEDTPDKCSPQSLEAVGRVLIHILYKKPITF